MKLLLLIFCIFTISCSYEDKLIAKAEPIKLSTYSVHLLAGEERIVDILSKVKDFGLQSKNSKIATGMWINDNKGILITANRVGNTSIYLEDRRNPDNFAEIKVTSDFLSGKYKENGDSATFFVQATDLTVREVIENELKDIAQKRSGILYSFDKETHVVEVDYSSSSHLNDKRTGTYEWEKDYLTFNFDGNRSKHGFAAVDEHTIIFSLDFLEKYQSEYPNASVGHARLDNHLSSLE